MKQCHPGADELRTSDGEKCSEALRCYKRLVEPSRTMHEERGSSDSAAYYLNFQYDQYDD